MRFKLSLIGGGGDGEWVDNVRGGKKYSIVRSKKNHNRKFNLNYSSAVITQEHINFSL